MSDELMSNYLDRKLTDQTERRWIPLLRYMLVTDQLGDSACGAQWAFYW